MKKKVVLVILFACYVFFAGAQTMKEGLFNAVKYCYDSWSREGDAEDENGNTIQYGYISYDIPNGYVETSGSWPTCGCGCKAQAAAFKNAKGKYTYVVSSYQDCGDYGNVFVKEDGADKVEVLAIMPKNFGLESFAGYKPEVPSRFFLSNQIRNPKGRYSNACYTKCFAYWCKA